MSHYRTIQALGTPNVIHQGVIDMLEDLELACFLSHFMYWSDKTDNPLGVYRSNEELYKQFKWSPAKVKTLSSKLEKLGLITKTHKRLEHRIYYKFNVCQFDKMYESHLANQQNHDSTFIESDIGESTKSRFANHENQDSPIAKIEIGESPKTRLADDENSDSFIQRLHTKITTKSESTHPPTETLKNQKNDNTKTKLIKPDDISEQVWQDLLKFRKQKTRSDMTVTAWNRNFKQLLIANQKTGHSLDDLIAFWITQGWQGFESDWYLNRQNQTNQNTASTNKPTANSFSAYGLNYLALSDMTAKETFDAVTAKMGRTYTFEEAYHLLKDELSGAVV